MHQKVERDVAPGLQNDALEEEVGFVLHTERRRRRVCLVLPLGVLSWTLPQFMM